MAPWLKPAGQATVRLTTAVASEGPPLVTVIEVAVGQAVAGGDAGQAVADRHAEVGRAGHVGGVAARHAARVLGARRDGGVGDRLGRDARRRPRTGR